MEQNFFHALSKLQDLGEKLDPEKQKALAEMTSEIKSLWQGGPTPPLLYQEISSPPSPIVWEESSEKRAKGEELLAQGKVAACIFAGGLGTRLGSEEPKGCVPIGKTSLFEHLFSKITSLEKKLGRELPLLIGLSSFTQEKTLSFLKNHAFFGKNPKTITYLLQKNYPYFTPEGNFLFSPETLIEQAPCGNGAFFDALIEADLITSFQNQGIEYLHFLSIDNPLDDPFDPFLLAEMKEAKSEAGALVLSRTSPQEKVGLIVRSYGKTIVLDYMEIPPSLLKEIESPNTLYRLGNIGHYCFCLKFLKKLSKQAISLPLHFVPKEIDFENQKMSVLKGEKFAMDLLHHTCKTTLLLYPREKHFSPLKKREDIAFLKSILTSS